MILPQIVIEILTRILFRVNIQVKYLNWTHDRELPDQT